MTCVIEVLWTPFNETSLAGSMCAGPALKATVVPTGPATLQLSIVVLLLAWRHSKKMGVIPWSNGVKSFTPFTPIVW